MDGWVLRFMDIIYNLWIDRRSIASFLKETMLKMSLKEWKDVRNKRGKCTQENQNRYDV